MSAEDTGILIRELRESLERSERARAEAEAKVEQVTRVSAREVGDALVKLSAARRERDEYFIRHGVALNERDEARGACVMRTTEAIRAETALSAAREALRSVEWARCTPSSHPWCPECHGMKPPGPGWECNVGHLDHCRLHAALSAPPPCNHDPRDSHDGHCPHCPPPEEPKTSAYDDSPRPYGPGFKNPKGNRPMTYIEAVNEANHGKLVSPDTWGPGEWIFMRDNVLRKRHIDGTDSLYHPAAEDEAAQWGFGSATLRREE